MSKRHQVNRRRSYGRRQHELHERMGSIAAVIDWLDESRVRDTVHIWDRAHGLRANLETLPAPQGID